MTLKQDTDLLENTLADMLAKRLECGSLLPLFRRGRTLGVDGRTSTSKATASRSTPNAARQPTHKVPANIAHIPPCPACLGLP
jgi:hypothetical protein